jgi:hypothetical protein
MSACRKVVRFNLVSVYDLTMHLNPLLPRRIISR